MTQRSALPAGSSCRTCRRGRSWVCPGYLTAGRARRLRRSTPIGDASRVLGFLPLGPFPFRASDDRRELHGADVVRRLRKSVLGGLRRPVDDGVLRQRVLDRAMEGLGDGVLAVVVVDLGHIVGLRLREVVEQEVHEVPPHRPRKLVERGELFGRVCEGMVLHGHVAEENSERTEQHLARSQIESGVLVLAVHERRRMEGYVQEPLGAKGALLSENSRELEAFQDVSGISKPVRQLIGKPPEIAHFAYRWRRHATCGFANGAKAARANSLAIAVGGLQATERLSFKTGVFGAIEPPKAVQRALWDINKNSTPLSLK